MPCLLRGLGRCLVSRLHRRRSAKHTQQDVPLLGPRLGRGPHAELEASQQRQQRLLSDSGVVVLLTKEFSKWVIVANLIAWPLSYFALNRWLQEFPYRTDIKLWIFLGTGLVTFLIAILTVSYQSLRAALSNPADSIRYE